MARDGSFFWLLRLSYGSCWSSSSGNIALVPSGGGQSPWMSMRNGKSPVTMSAQWHREPVPILCLRQVTFFGFEGVRNMQSQVAELLAQGLAGYPQQTGGLVRL